MKTVVVDWSVRGQIRDQEENRQGGSGASGINGGASVWKSSCAAAVEVSVIARSRRCAGTGAKYDLE